MQGKRAKNITLRNRPDLKIENEPTVHIKQVVVNIMERMLLIKASRAED